ncbi:MAG: DUF1549 domain-containing protein [Verrucomicrobiota bacterium]|nr:DUF1549 domain-containing protein [Verrucomicrobiota bacterium]
MFVSRAILFLRQILLLFTLAFLRNFEGTGQAAEVEFLRDVRPILSSHCFKCHGPDEGTRKGKLRLDLPEEAIKAGKSGAVAIVPGKPEESEVIKRIFTSDEDDLMPPPEAKHPINEQQKEILRQWIKSGAEYVPHWAFQKPKAPVIPEVKNKTWPQNEIDYFVLARLEKEGLAPAGKAPREILLRRVYLDLTGLPPTIEQSEEFLKDSSPDAYEKLVDRLLASPHYGERWARRWLDLARYADTNGYEKDRVRSMWPYRDWVINALNKDMPFDQFTIEQLAGDMLPDATLEQKIATGFHRNSMINEEGGSDPLEFRFHAMVDRVHVTATTWLGLTMACAQCHTHKYDPIQHSEYYKFMAFMNNADEPTIEVPKPDVSAKRKEGLEKLAAMERSLPEQFPVESQIQWITPAGAEFSSQEGLDAELLPDGSFRIISEKNPESDLYTIIFDTPTRRITHIQLEAIPDEKVRNGGPGRTDHGNFVLSEIEVEIGEIGSRESRKAKLINASADYAQNDFPVGNAIDGKLDSGWAIAQEGKRLHRRAQFQLEEIWTHTEGGRVTVRLHQQYGKQHTLGRFKISVGSEEPDERSLAERRKEHLEKKFSKWLERESTRAVTWERLTPIEASSPTPTLDIEPEGIIFASGDFTKSDTYTVRFKGVSSKIKAVRLEALPDDRLPKGGPGRVYYEGPEGDFFLSEFKLSAGGKVLQLTNATESFAKDKTGAGRAIDGDLQSGWSIEGAQGRTHNAVFHLVEALESGGDLQVELTMERYYASPLGKFRIWITSDDGAIASPLPQESYEALLAHQNGTAEPAQLERLLKEFIRITPDLKEPRKQVEEARNNLPKLPTTLALKERSPNHARTTRRHHRGEFLQAKEEVMPDVPSFLPAMAKEEPKNRLTFAKWLVSKENPLTGRVVMNRHWEAFFGRGLVRTLEDFGFQGELPSHPELLDWLALEFPKQGWSQKKMHKKIVMSATYQQASDVTPELMERDPLNVLLTRGPRFRVEAELVRDLGLVASGLFSAKVGGPSVFPPQPPGVSTEGAYGPLEWKVSQGEDRYRRGLYTFAKRTAPYAMSAAFDGPSGEACLARRERSNTPLQALTLLNDEVFMETARALGRWAVNQKLEQKEVTTQLFRRCLTRSPKADEIERLLKFYEQQLVRFKSGELNAADLIGEAEENQKPEQAAWTALARVLLNLDETITKS